jgi:hypothetical protein
MAQGGGKLCKSYIPNDHEIYITGRKLLGPGDRAIDKGPVNVCSKGLQRLLEYIDYTHRLSQEALEFRQKWAMRIGLKIHPVAILAAVQDASLGKRSQFALQARWWYTKMSRQVTQVPPALRVQ